ncbi:carbohydrate kinase [Seongchinamella unica]|uniref:Carbohydrate kinase n=1 Tax=Seongchinamella unica TaxID=2547392 RepID=A0A4R5LTB2_9GAMM|nr:carbohydrate kinase [Seongchinamella unica]TDG13987.1 carbohydrate kinase [Seongchinamella unica]
MNNRICIFGEVLFDHFPDGSRVMGGAPFNVAWHLQAFGLSPYFVSRTGQDPEGELVRQTMRSWGMDTDGLQTDAALPTGKVQVTFVDGEPGYDIVENCAYDAIEPPDLQSCDILYHGSLALRSKRSADTIRALRGITARQVFIDVNLRDPWWHRREIESTLVGSNWVKLNVHELELLASTDVATAADFLDSYGLEGLIVTHGAEGAELVLANGLQEREPAAEAPELVDTVGAGDAFSSVMLLGIALEWPAKISLQRAQAFAASIVGRRGATVQDPAFYADFLGQWGLSN